MSSHVQPAVGHRRRRRPRRGRGCSTRRATRRSAAGRSRSSPWYAEGVEGEVVHVVLGEHVGRVEALLQRFEHATGGELPEEAVVDQEQVGRVAGGDRRRDPGDQRLAVGHLDELDGDVVLGLLERRRRACGRPRAPRPRRTRPARPSSAPPSPPHAAGEPAEQRQRAPTAITHGRRHHRRCPEEAALDDEEHADHRRHRRDGAGQQQRLVASGRGWPACRLPSGR